MKKIAILFLLLSTALISRAQHKKVDSLYINLGKANSDTTRANALLALSRHYYISSPDSSIIFGQQAYELAEKHNWVIIKGKCLNDIANAYASVGDYLKGMQFYFKTLRTYESINYLRGIASANNNIGATDIQKEDFKNALPYLWRAQKQLNSYALSNKLLLVDKQLKAIILDNIGEDYLYIHKTDSAEYYLKLCKQYSEEIKFVDIQGPIQRDLGEVEIVKGNKIAALKYFREAISTSLSIDDVENLSIAYLSTASLFHKNKQQDSAEYYAKKALETARAGKYEQDVLNAGKVLYAYYDEDRNLPEAYKYFKLTTEAKDSLFSQDKVKQLLSISFDEKQRQQDIAEAKDQYQNKVRIYALAAGLVILMLLSFIFWRNSRQRQAANHLLQKQKEDIESALLQLQLTQTQLIQSEKMASLGELTAGIAHEIQNPLNFINNFSEVNAELIDEMQNGIDRAAFDEVKEIAGDIKENQLKISQHGKRADFIVKGMLQHSRTSTGERQPTNINLLADEFLKLSYHGLRAKDKSFNAEMVTHFDENLPKINVVQQDIGRVLLNLFNNAFYAVQKKQKTAGPGYKPLVEVTTYATPSLGWAIKVKDNGIGIPEHIKDKIMQPFFTTKAAGEGTGLGLSLTYDMVVKGHGGTIDLISIEGEGSEFIITLPKS